MFGKKKTITPPPTVTAAIQTIPADFYAGANPTVTFKTVKKEIIVEQPVLSTRDKKALDKATAVGRGQPLHPVHFFASNKFVFISIGSLFVLCVAGATWYYWRQAQSARPPTVPVAVPVVVTQTPPIVPPVPPPPVATTTPEAASTSISILPPPLSEAPINFPSRLLGDSVDSDNDGLTDVSEELFGTDPFNPDTDGDKYPDGHEVYNLYDPKKTSDAKLIDSGIVQEYQNPAFGYKIYYPTSWAVGNVDPDYKDVLFSTITGEHVEVRAFDKGDNYNFTDWFGKWAPTEKFTDLMPFESVFKQSGMRRSDYLTFYFEDQNHVYVMLYHTTDSSVTNYRIIIKMMARSWRFAGNTNALPPLPVESPGISTPAAATTTTSTVPAPATPTTTMVKKTVATSTKSTP